MSNRKREGVQSNFHVACDIADLTNDSVGMDRKVLDHNFVRDVTAEKTDDAPSEGICEG